jgi:hypothetical protein
MSPISINILTSLLRKFSSFNNQNPPTSTLKPNHKHCMPRQHTRCPSSISSSLRSSPWAPSPQSTNSAVTTMSENWPQRTFYRVTGALTRKRYLAASGEASAWSRARAMIWKQASLISMAVRTAVTKTERVRGSAGLIVVSIMTGSWTGDRGN